MTCLILISKKKHFLKLHVKRNQENILCMENFTGGLKEKNIV